MLVAIYSNKCVSALSVTKDTRRTSMCNIYTELNSPLNLLNSRNARNWRKSETEKRCKSKRKNALNRNMGSARIFLMGADSSDEGAKIR